MLIGQKYGYRPIPASIDAEEFDAICKQLDDLDKDHSVLDVWYLRDDNMIPPQYILQPIDSILKNYDSSVSVPKLKTFFLRTLKLPNTYM
jgi:hypothetical protein